jgi:hypothetical protein
MSLFHVGTDNKPPAERGLKTMLGEIEKQYLYLNTCI